MTLTACSPLDDQDVLSMTAHQSIIVPVASAAEMRLQSNF